VKTTPRTALAVLVAVIALVLSAAAGATASRLITGKQVKDGSLTSADVRNRTLKPKDFSAKAKSKLRGPAGETGPRGATGPAGPQGAAGLSGFEVITRTVSIPGLGGTDSITAACPAGKKAIAATAGYAAPLVNLVSQVTRTSDTAFSASGLNLLGSLSGQVLTLDVVCATIPS
jgi:hypothetical protein